MLNEDVYRNFNSMAYLEGQLNLLGKSEQSKETHILNGKIQIFQISAKKFLENQELEQNPLVILLVVVAENFCEMLKLQIIWKEAYLEQFVPQRRCSICNNSCSLTSKVGR